MLFALLFALSCCLPTVFGYCYQTVVAPVQGGMVQSWRPGCGLCPPQSECPYLVAITLGYCCGYKREGDVPPIACAADLVCPPPSALLWNDYNYLMDCCC